MGKSMYNFGKQGKEKAKQKKQMDKAAKRIMAKWQKANLKTGTPNADLNMEEPEPMDEIIKKHSVVAVTPKKKNKG